MTDVGDYGVHSNQGTSNQVFESVDSDAGKPGLPGRLRAGRALGKGKSWSAILFSELLSEETDTPLIELIEFMSMVGLLALLKGN